MLIYFSFLFAKSQIILQFQKAWMDIPQCGQLMQTPSLYKCFSNILRGGEGSERPLFSPLFKNERCDFCVEFDSESSFVSICKAVCSWESMLNCVISFLFYN